MVELFRVNVFLESTFAGPFLLVVEKRVTDYTLGIPHIEAFHRLFQRRPVQPVKYPLEALQVFHAEPVRGPSIHPEGEYVKPDSPIVVHFIKGVQKLERFL